MKPLISLAMVICCVILVSAQERVIDKLEFDSVAREPENHPVKLSGKAYRMTIETGSQVVGRQQTEFSSKSITEFGPEKESRTVSSSTFGGKPSSRRETIVIGKWEYSRTVDDGPWTRKERETGAKKITSVSNTDPYEIVSSTMGYKFLGSEVLEGQKTSIYLKTEKEKRLNKADGKTSELKSTRKFWIGPDGFQLRYEYRAESRSDAMTHYTTINMKWELDPKIVIREPANP